MGRYGRLVLAIILGQFLLSNLLYAQPNVRVGIYQNKPKIFLDADGRPKGIFIDIIEEIASREGWHLDYVPGTWSECLARLEKGEIDIMPDVAYSKVRVETYSFSTETVLSNWAQLYTRKSSGIRYITDLKGKTIVVMKGDYSYWKFKKELRSYNIKSKFVEVDDFFSVFEHIEGKKADAGIISRLFGLRYEHAYRVDRSPLSCCPAELRFAAPKNKNQHLLKAIDRHVADMIRDEGSIYHRSLARWLELEGRREFPGWLKWVLGIVAGASLLILGANLALKSQVEAKTRELRKELKERRELERALRKERDRAQNYLNLAGTIIVALDFNGSITLINRMGLQLLGWREDEILGENWFDLCIPERLVSQVKEIFHRIVTGEIEPLTYYENPVVTRTGEERIIAWYNTLLQDEAGNVIGTISSGNDVTERRRAEAELKESEEKFRELAENIREVFWISDALKTEMFYVSPAYEEVWGRSLESLYEEPRSFLEAVHPEDREGVMESFERQARGEQVKVTYRVIRPDGSLRWISSRAFPVKGGDGGVKRITGIAEDVTEQKETEEKIKASLREKEVLLREIHHRVKNNLQVISSLLDLSAGKTKSGEAAAVLSDARSKIYTMALIHSQLYQKDRFDKINMGRHIEELVEYLRQVYAGVAARVMSHIEPSDVSLTINQAIPLSLALNELITNVYKHAFKESQEGLLAVSIERSRDGTVNVSVKDDGEGMPEDVDIDMVDTLGLRLARGLVQDQLGGEITIKRNRGTEVNISFKAE